MVQVSFLSQFFAGGMRFRGSRWSFLGHFLQVDAFFAGGLWFCDAAGE